MNISNIDQEFPGLLPDLTATDGFSFSTSIRYLPFHRTAEILNGNFLPYRLDGAQLPKVYCAPASSQAPLAARETGYLQHRITPGSVIWSVVLIMTTNPIIAATNVQVRVREACGGRTLAQTFQFGRGYAPTAVFREAIQDPPFIVSTQGLVDVEVTNISANPITYQLQLKVLEPLEFEPVIGRR